MTSRGFAIPDGSRCVFDANVLLHAHEGRSDAARELLRRCAASELIGIMPSTVWAEVMHKLMIAEALRSGGVAGPNPARKLAEHPEVVRALTLYRLRLADYRRLGMLFEPCIAEDVLAAAPSLQRDYRLLTNDSIVLACALRIRADYLVSADRAFARAGGIRVVLIEDVR